MTTALAPLSQLLQLGETGERLKGRAGGAEVWPGGEGKRDVGQHVEEEEQAGKEKEKDHLVPTDHFDLRAYPPLFINDPLSTWNHFHFLNLLIQRLRCYRL